MYNTIIRWKPTKYLMLHKQINGFLSIMLNLPKSLDNWHMNDWLLIKKNIMAYMFILVHIKDQAKN